MNPRSSEKKILIIRFSSFGDLLQSLSIPAAIKSINPTAEIHFLTRADYAELLEYNPHITKIWAFDRRKKIIGLWKLGLQLRKQNFTHLYDAHNNLRSHILSWMICGPLGIFRIFNGIQFVRKSQYRWRRFLLFRFRINLYPKPFVGQWALLEPLQKWNISLDLPAPPQLFIRGFLPNHVQDFLQNSSIKLPIVGLCPSASYELKRWPLRYWEQLIRLCPNYKFILFGGPEDHFIAALEKIDTSRVLNVAGQLTYKESALAIRHCQILVSNDTGLMHVAEQFGIPCAALMGPAPFGYPGRPTTKIFELDLPCRPCSKHGQGPCVNSIQQKCMVEILPEYIALYLKDILGI